MARPNLTRAQRLRAMREAFELGLQMGCTPAEAVARQTSAASLERLSAPSPRQRAKQAAKAPTLTLEPETPPEAPRGFWWKNL